MWGERSLFRTWDPPRSGSRWPNREAERPGIAALFSPPCRFVLSGPTSDRYHILGVGRGAMVAAARGGF